MRRTNLPPHSVPPLVGPQDKGKVRAELSSSPCYEEGRDLPVVGPDDYMGALSGGSDQGGEESQSDGGKGNESSSPFPPSGPTKKTRSKPSANTKKYVRISAVDVVDNSLSHSVLGATVVRAFPWSLKSHLNP